MDLVEVPLAGVRTVVYARRRCQAVRFAHQALMVTWMLRAAVHHGGLASPTNIL